MTWLSHQQSAAHNICRFKQRKYLPKIFAAWSANQEEFAKMQSLFAMFVKDAEWQKDGGFAGSNNTLLTPTLQ